MISTEEGLLLTPSQVTTAISWLIETTNLSFCPSTGTTIVTIFPSPADNPNTQHYTQIFEIKELNT